MAVVQIPNLPPAVALSGAEQLEAVQAGTTVRVSTGLIADLASGAAADSAAAAAASAADAAASAGDASTSAGQASSSASGAASSAGAASTSAGQASTSAGQAATSAGQAATSASNASTSASNAASSASSASTSLTTIQTIASTSPYPTFVSTTAALANGVKSTTGIVGGSGGTNGQFDVAFSGGGATVQATARFTVAGGALTSITLVSPGYGYTSPPTMSFAASSGLVGASATAVIGANVPVGGYFFVPSTNVLLTSQFYRVDAGPVATSINGIPSATPVVLNTDPTRYAAFRQNTYDIANPYVRVPLTNAGGLYPDDLAAWTTTGATINSDGTITIPNGVTIKSPNISSAATVWNYFWIAETAPTYLSSLTFGGYFNGTSNPIPTSSVVTTLMTNGVTKIAVQNNNGSGSAYGYVNLWITNNTGASVTLYSPQVTLVNASVAPTFTPFDTQAPTLPAKPVSKRFDFWNAWNVADKFSRQLEEKLITKSVDSVNGSDSNSGLGIRAPKQTLGAVPAYANSDVVGLWRGSVFSTPANDPLTTYDVTYRDISGASASKALPQITAQTTAPNGSWTNNGDGTYSYSWTSAGTMLNSAGYEIVYAVEIDTSAEASTPYAAQRQMAQTASAADCIATPGTCFATGSGTSWSMRIHPSDNLAPGAGAYRYTVCNYSQLMNFTANNNPARVISGITFIAGSGGYGPVGGPPYTFLDRCVFINGAAHQSVNFSGTVQRSLYYSNLYSGSGHVFYNSQNVSFNWEIKDTFFIGTSGFYSHTSGSVPDYAFGSVRRCYFIGGRDSYGTLRSTPNCGAANTTKWEVTDCYFQGVALPYVSSATTSTIKDCLFNGVSSMRLPNVLKNCIFQFQNWNDPTVPGNRGMGVNDVGSASTSLVENNLFHYRWMPYSPLLVSDGSGRAMARTSSPTTTFNKNIIVFDSQAATGALYYTARFSAGDYNVYILVRGTNSWVYTDPATRFGWETYLSYYAGINNQDANSLQIDLRNDPRGINAIFVDANNGDYRWADTPVAQTVAKYCRDNGVGPDWSISKWPYVPAVDEAADIIRDV